MIYGSVVDVSMGRAYRAYPSQVWGSIPGHGYARQPLRAAQHFISVNHGVSDVYKHGAQGRLL